MKFKGIEKRLSHIYIFFLFTFFQMFSPFPPFSCLTSSESWIMCSINTPFRQLLPRPLPEAESLPIYLDYNATTRLCDEAWKAIMEHREIWGNPSSSHPYGLAAKFALDKAREEVACAIGANRVDNARPHAVDTEGSSSLSSLSPSIIFTSGGTESNNLAIVGGARSVRKKHPERNVIVLSSYEHPAVEEVVKELTCDTKNGSFTCCRVAVNPSTGVLDEPLLRHALQHSIPGGPGRVALVTIMLANNEIGAVNPIADLCRTVKALCGDKAVFHTDAAQAIGKVRVDVDELKVDFLSICGHKFYAPKGSGALYVKDPSTVSRILYGAGHEQGLRPGTENVMFAASLAKALTAAVTTLLKEQEKMKAARDEIVNVLRMELEKFNMSFVVNGSLETCLPNTLNCSIFKNTTDLRNDLAVSYISAARLIQTLGHKVCISAGSACHSSASAEEIVVSAPLKAVGVDIHRAIGTLRISTGRYLSISEARRAAVIIARGAAQQFAE